MMMITYAIVIILIFLYPGDSAANEGDSCGIKNSVSGYGGACLNDTNTPAGSCPANLTLVTPSDNTSLCEGSSTGTPALVCCEEPEPDPIKTCFKADVKTSNGSTNVTGQCYTPFDAKTFTIKCNPLMSQLDNLTAPDGLCHEGQWCCQKNINGTCMATAGANGDKNSTAYPSNPLAGTCKPECSSTETDIQKGDRSQMMPGFECGEKAMCCMPADSSNYTST